MTETQCAIFDQMHQALANLGAMSDLLCITGSFGDTLDDEEVLTMLKDWNADNNKQDCKHSRLSNLENNLNRCCLDCGTPVLRIAEFKTYSMQEQRAYVDFGGILID